MKSRSLIPLDRYQPISHSHTQHMIQDCLQMCQTDLRARGPRFPNNCVTGHYHQYVYRKCTGKSYEDGGGVILNHIEGHWADLFVLKGNAVLIACLFLITVALLGIGASLGLRMGFYGNAFWSSSSNSLNVLWRRLLKKWCLYNDFQWVSQWETSWIPEHVTFWQTIIFYLIKYMVFHKIMWPHFHIPLSLVDRLPQGRVNVEGLANLSAAISEPHLSDKMSF